METNKIILLSGATGGIGSKISEKLIEKGYSLILLARDEVKLELLTRKLKKINEEVVIAGYLIDLNDFASIENTIEKIYEDFPKIDVIINNAGVGYFKPIVDVTLEELQQTININIIAVYLITKIVIKHMITDKSKIYQIINISSIAGTKSFNLGSIYNTSKFALEGFTNSLWQEVKKNQIRICSIKPGLVNTNFFENKDDFPEICYALQPEDIANCILFVLSQSEYSNINEIVIRPFKIEAQDLFNKIIQRSI